MCRLHVCHRMTSRKKLLVIGASSGIGAATAIRFAKEGWDVCFSGRREDCLRDQVDRAFPGNHLTFAVDYSNEFQMSAMENLLRSEWGHLDAVINSAGISYSVPANGEELDKLTGGFHIMTSGAILASRLAVRMMPEGGRIVHLTSIHAERAEPGAAGYSMAKAAISQYVRVLAMEFAPRNILVNAIAPGFVDTEMSRASGVNELETPWFTQNYIDGHHLPLRRAGRPEEIAGVAWFLCGPDATYITGQCLVVDGGLTITF